MRLFSHLRSFPRVSAGKKSSTLRGFVAASSIGVALLAGVHSAFAQTAVFDSITGVTGYTYTTNTPHSQLGQVFTLGNIGQAQSPIRITGTDFILGSTTAATYNFLQVTQYFWATASGASQSTNPTSNAYSTLLGANTITYSNITLGAGIYSFTPGAAVYSSIPVVLSGLSAANTIGFSEKISTSTDGITYTLNENLVPAFSTGTPAVGTSAFNTSTTATNYYRNANSESNGNFIGSDQRTLNGLQYIAVRLYATSAAAPEPGSLPLLGMGLVSGAGTLGMAARRRRKATANA